MKAVSKFIFALAALCLSCAAQSSDQNPVSLPAGSAQIIELKGDVSVTAPQSLPVAAQIHQVLLPNFSLETKKGTALLTLSDGSQVLVKSNSRVVLRLPSEANGNLLEQLVGKIIAKIKKRTGSEPSFQMGTPSAVITVRGTRFLVEVNRKQHTYVLVYEGVVEVDGIGAFHHPVYLQPGFSTQVGRNEPPEAPTRPVDELRSRGSDGRLTGRDASRDNQDQTARPSGDASEHETPD